MLIKGNIKVILIMCMLVIWMTGCARQSLDQSATNLIPPSQEKPLKLLNESAEALYNYTKDGQFEAARVELDRFSDLLTMVSYKGITELEGVNALTKAVINAKRTYNRIQLSRQEALIAATQLRLIADALTHPNKPLWHEYEQLLKQDTEQLIQMVNANNDVGSLAALQKLYQHYTIIQPAIVISKDVSFVERVNSLFNFLTVELSRSKVNYTNVSQGIGHLGNVWNELFSGEKQTSGALMIQSNQIIWTTVIASVIITALAYVAWRRYRVL